MSKNPAFPEERIGDEQPSMDQMAIAIRNEEGRLRKTDTLYGDGEPWDPQRVAVEIQRMIAGMAFSLANTAKLVAWGHERLSYAEWLVWLRETVHISEGMGYRYLSVAQKFQPRDMKIIKRLPAGAVFEYFSCPEEDLQQFRKEIEAHGTILGHDVNKDDRKGIRELCRDFKRLKEEKKQVERSRDDLKLRLVEKARQAASLQERIGEPRMRLESMIQACVDEAFRILCDEPAATWKYTKFMVSQSFYFAFKKVWSAPQAGDPLVEPPLLDELDHVFHRVLDKPKTRFASLRYGTTQRYGACGD